MNHTYIDCIIVRSISRNYFQVKLTNNPEVKIYVKAKRNLVQGRNYKIEGVLDTFMLNGKELPLIEAQSVWGFETAEGATQDCLGIDYVTINDVEVKESIEDTVYQVRRRTWSNKEIWQLNFNVRARRQLPKNKPMSLICQFIPMSEDSNHPINVEVVEVLNQI